MFLTIKAAGNAGQSNKSLDSSGGHIRNRPAFSTALIDIYRTINYPAGAISFSRGP